MPRSRGFVPAVPGTVILAEVAPACGCSPMARAMMASSERGPERGVPGTTEPVTGAGSASDGATFPSRWTA